MTKYRCPTCGLVAEVCSPVASVSHTCPKAKPRPKMTAFSRVDETEARA